MMIENVKNGIRFDEKEKCKLTFVIAHERERERERVFSMTKRLVETS